MKVADIYPPSSTTIIVGVGDMRVCRDSFGSLSTYALGSCLGVVAYDSQIHAGGILHFMLPECLSLRGQHEVATKFADTGFPIFWDALCSLGVRRESVKFALAGGAAMDGIRDIYQIGQRNISEIRKIFKSRSLRSCAEELGGTDNRTLLLSLASGVLTIKPYSHNGALSAKEISLL